MNSSVVTQQMIAEFKAVVVVTEEIIIEIIPDIKQMEGWLTVNVSVTEFKGEPGFNKPFSNLM